MKNKRTLILTSLICLIPILVGAAVYSRLPETMATHWNFQGEPDGWSSRPVAVFALPGLLLAVNLLLPLGLKADPKHENMSPALKTVVFWTIPVLSLVCSGATIAAGLGCHLSIERIIPALMGVLFVLIGNYLPKTKQSYTLGIRLPWTLASEENWNRTHRLGGFLWVIGGLYFIVMSFFTWNLAALLIPILLMALVPTVYSYLLYRRGI